MALLPHRARPWIPLLALAMTGSLSWGAGEPAAIAETDEAISLYDRGRYAEALPRLREMDGRGPMSGPLLYRLFFCLQATGDRAAAGEVLTRAVQVLERENVTTGTLEVPFYLANAYRNLNRPSDAREIAEATTAKVEGGGVATPTHPMEQFRLAKLYEDQGRPAQAASWYRKALEGFAGLDEAYPGNVRWARRYLAQEALARADYAVAARELEMLIEAGDPQPADLDRLAVARLRAGEWAKAAEAWRRAEQVDPAGGNRARYSWRLAAMADRIGSLPTADPSGRPWARLSREDLEAVLSEQAAAARAVRSPFLEPPEGTSLDRASAETRLLEAQAFFVAAGLEYTARNLPIRETAFMGGYAPLIFRVEEWQLPPP